jgi:hypothetical protein
MTLIMKIEFNDHTGGPVAALTVAIISNGPVNTSFILPNFLKRVHGFLRAQWKVIGFSKNSRRLGAKCNEQIPLYA